MIKFLRLFFLVVLLTMLSVTVWASLETSILKIPKSVLGHPWFIATLFDAYFAFLVFYFWVVYKEKSVGARAVWFILIMALGNIAIASYMLWKLFKLPANASMSDLLLRKA